MQKVVVITGAANGIGKAIALLYSNKNYLLILSDQDSEGLKKFKKNNINTISGDITKKATIQAISKLVYEKYKRIDILINNAGITYIQPFEENTEEQLDKILATNLKSHIILTHQLYNLMVKQRSGHIININSSAGKEGKINHTLYCTSKFGLYGFTQSLRLEAKKYNIRVTSIHPGGAKTNIYQDKLPSDFSNYMDPNKIAKIVVDLSETEGVCPDELIINRLK